MAGKKQFDVEDALDRAVLAFWTQGYAETSVETLSESTGLGRSSLYGTFGDKNALFVRALDRYRRRWGDQYDAALARHPHDPAKAVAAYLDVILSRIADPDLPDGCLVAISAAQAGTMNAGTLEHVQAALADQRSRLLTALTTRGLPRRRAEDLASFLLAVTQSLGVLSRAGTPTAHLRAVARTSVAAVADAAKAADLTHASRSPSKRRDQRRRP